MLAKISRLVIVVAILASVVFLFGCAANPPAANNVYAATAEGLGDLSDEVDRAEWRGWINAETEYELQTDLLKALNILDEAIALQAGQCDPPLTRQECVQNVILEVEQRLREAKP